MVVMAPAGVGKSRLARETLAEAERDGAVGLWVQATQSAASVPLGAFAPVIPSEVRSDDSFELLRRSAQMLHERAGARPLVVGVDDAHLLDPSSAALVLHLVSSATAFVLATVRRGEPCPDAIVSLWKDEDAWRLDLEALGEEETKALAEAIVGGPLEQGTRRWIWETSLGNALYVRELVLGALGGALRHEKGLWRLSVTPSVSASLAELITARMVGLSDAERKALELLALGEPLDIPDLAELVGREPLPALEERGLIAVEGRLPRAQARLAHPLYGETIRAAVASLHARELQLLLAERVRSRAELSSEDALRVARWLLDAGEPIPTPVLVQAACAATASADPGLGAELAAQAVDAGAGFQATLLLGRACMRCGRYEEAESVLAAAENEIVDRDDALEYLELRRSVLYWGLRRPEAVGELLSRAESWWPDSDWRHRLDPFRLRVAAQGRAEGMGSAVSESAELLAKPDLDPALRRQLEAVRLLGLFYSGQAREAYEFARRICPTPPLRDDIDDAIFATRIGAALEGGEGWEELEDWAPEALSWSVRLGDHAAAGMAALALGGLRLREGRFTDARRWLAEAELHLEQRDAVCMLSAVAALQVGAAWQLGEGAEVGLALERFHAMIGDDDPLPIQVPYVSMAEGWAALAQGDVRRAQRVLLDGATEVAGKPIYAARLSYEALRAGAPARRVADTLTAAAERSDSCLISAAAAHARAVAAGDGGALLDVAEVLERIGAVRNACEAAADAARIFLATGRQDSARRAAARSRALFIPGQGGWLPTIEGLDEAEVSLTRRESQLVDLAAHGLSNAQIAERLVLSIRTVESHLYRAMQKLGVNDRHQLASLRPSRRPQ